MTSLSIGGVHEHFNMPWHRLFESQVLQEAGIQPHWTDFHGGTGAMVEGLNSGAVDMAVLLTEGAIHGINQGGAYRILSFYVSSPLLWGIHVPADSPYQKMADVKGRRYAISRYGSGSHLMSFVDAQKRQWSYENLDFVVVKNLQGAREAFQKREADIFFWEKFTTKPLVDAGEFRRIAERPTPYACFVVCATEKALAEKAGEIQFCLKEVYKAARKLRQNPSIDSIIANYYGLQPEDVTEWLTSITWPYRRSLSRSALNKAITTLKSLDLIQAGLEVDDVIWSDWT
ncbi:MAG: PhnD/SsuA/transferrin family substrate-binding protein [Bacteroidota bacterium]